MPSRRSPTGDEYDSRRPVRWPRQRFRSRENSDQGSSSLSARYAARWPNGECGSVWTSPTPSASARQLAGRSEAPRRSRRSRRRRCRRRCIPSCRRGRLPIAGANERWVQSRRPSSLRRCPLRSDIRCPTKVDHSRRCGAGGSHRSIRPSPLRCRCDAAQYNANRGAALMVASHLPAWPVQRRGWLAAGARFGSTRAGRAMVGRLWPRTLRQLGLQRVPAKRPTRHVLGDRGEPACC